MPKDDNLPQMGSRNIRNLDSMVAAGLMTQAQADKIRAKAMAKKKNKSLLSKDS